MSDIKQGERVVFGIAADPDVPGNQVIVLGVSNASWRYMRDGKTHTFNLTRLGVPVKIILYGGRTQEICRNMLTLEAGALDVSDKDFSV